MRRRYEPRPNYARLWRNRAKRENWQNDFRGKILLQDGISYFVGVMVRRTFAGEEYLAIYLRPELPLAKNGHSALADVTPRGRDSAC
jgi:hypothetical protein